MTTLRRLITHDTVYGGRPSRSVRGVVYRPRAWSVHGSVWSSRGSPFAVSAAAAHQLIGMSPSARRSGLHMRRSSGSRLAALQRDAHSWRSGMHMRCASIRACASAHRARGQSSAVRHASASSKCRALQEGVLIGIAVRALPSHPRASGRSSYHSRAHSILMNF